MCLITVIRNVSNFCKWCITAHSHTLQTVFTCPQPLLLLGQCCWSNSAMRYVSAVHTGRLCKMHHNCLAAPPPAPSCYVQIYQNTFFAKFWWQRSWGTKKVIDYLVAQLPILLQKSGKLQQDELYILWQFELEAVSFSGGTYQRGLLLTAALRAWPPSSLPHYDALHCRLSPAHWSVLLFMFLLVGINTQVCVLIHSSVKFTFPKGTRHSIQRAKSCWTMRRSDLHGK